MVRPKRQQIERRIGAAAVALVLVCAGPVRSIFAEGAPQQVSAQSASRANTAIARRRHLHHVYDHDAVRPSYYGRPIYYAPAPFFPFPPFLAYGWEPW